MTDERFLGLDATTQTAAIAAVGLVMVVVGESMSSKADPEYNPMVVGIGVVMVLYGVGRFLYERLAG